MLRRSWFLTLVIFFLAGCSVEPEFEFDTLIVNGLVYTGELKKPQSLSVGILGDRIEFVGSLDGLDYKATNLIDASGKWVIPGFIDPHSHSFEDLLTDDIEASRNNLAQGVTTVFYGNDGYGSPYIDQQFAELDAIGPTINVALFAGHGTIRSIVMGRVYRQPTESEMTAMKALLEQAMKEGALGLSTGLFYVPGTYSDTEEVIELAKVAAQYGGVYESHIRDESNYNIGVVAAVDEVIEIAKQANIPVHIAHIKALGVDVWGKSAEIIARVQQAQIEGVTVTADQYPWLASGVKIHKALLPNWALAGDEEAIQARLNDPKQIAGVKALIKENIRRRGGPDSLLVVISPNQEIVGKNLAEIAELWDMEPADAALRIFSFGVIEPWTRVASFNMNETDVEAFMSQPWVMTSSDGTDGHPRKFASFPEKYQQYVVNKPLISAEEFVHRSTALVAETFSLPDRGYLKQGYYADIAIFDPDEYKPGADFAHWDKLGRGVDYLFVNGGLVIETGIFTAGRHGRALKLHSGF